MNNKIEMRFIITQAINIKVREMVNGQWFNKKII